MWSVQASGTSVYRYIYPSTHIDIHVHPLSTYISCAFLGPPMQKSPANPPPRARSRRRGTPEAPDQALPAPGRTAGGRMGAQEGGRAAARRTGGSRDAFLIFTKSARRGSAHVKKWPTLYGKVHRARTTPIVNPVPENNFPARERLHGVRPPNPGRRVCVKARDLSRLYVFPARLISFLVLVC